MAKRDRVPSRTAKAAAAGGAAELGERLRAARAKAGMTRRQLARASSTSERYLANIETGTGNPSVSMLSSLAAALDVGVAELLPVGGERNAAIAEAASALRRLPATSMSEATAWLHGQHAPSASKARRIVLIGLRGAGKSTLGADLAQRLAVPFIEMSREVEHAYGGEIGMLIELGGQSALRQYERVAWEAIVATHSAAVIAASGGVVADSLLFDRMLATAHAIWLEARPEDHMERVMAQGDFRPMASNRSAMADLKAILKARSADYGRAERRVDTSAQSLDRTQRALERIARGLVGNE